MIIVKRLSSDLTLHEILHKVSAEYGLTPQMITQIWREPRNAPLLVNGQPPAMTSRFIGNPDLYIPLNAALRHHSIAETDPAAFAIANIGGPALPSRGTHGATIKASRNLGIGTSIAWLQTVKRENDPDATPGRPREFVDTGLNNTPFSTRDPHRRFLFTDTPCGNTAPTGPQLRWEGMLSLVLRHRNNHGPDVIALLAGVIWGFEVVARQVQLLARRDANATDFAHQLTVLRNGVSQLGQSTGGHFHYLDGSAPSFTLRVD